MLVGPASQLPTRTRSSSSTPLRRREFKTLYMVKVKRAGARVFGISVYACDSGAKRDSANKFSITSRSLSSTSPHSLRSWNHEAWARARAFLARLSLSGHTWLPLSISLVRLRLSALRDIALREIARRRKIERERYGGVEAPRCSCKRGKEINGAWGGGGGWCSLVRMFVYYNYVTCFAKELEKRAKDERRCRERKKLNLHSRAVLAAARQLYTGKSRETLFRDEKETLHARKHAHTLGDLVIWPRCVGVRASSTRKKERSEKTSFWTPNKRKNFSVHVVRRVMKHRCEVVRIV